jgi:hypothetical protein
MIRHGGGNLPMTKQASRYDVCFQTVVHNNNNNNKIIITTSSDQMK